MTALRDKLLRSLRVGRRVARARRPSAELSQMWGARLTPWLVALVDHLGERSAKTEPSVGELTAMAPDDWLPGDRNAFDFMLAEPFRRVALLSGAVALASSGAGDTWLIEVSPAGKRNGVYLFDHEASEVHAIADGLDSLALLLTCDGEKVAGLDGHVRGYNDVEVPDDVTPLEDGGPLADRFGAAEELLGALAFGPRLPARPSAKAPTHPADLVVQALRA